MKDEIIHIIDELLNTVRMSLIILTKEYTSVEPKEKIFGR